jgi:Trypsin-co-occurring domain 1
MDMVKVLVGETIVESAGGIVGHGTSPDEQHGAQEAVQKVVKKVIEVSADKIVDSVVEIANKIGPVLKGSLQKLSGIAVHEVSIGCAIGADGNIVVAGVQAEASLTITFRI